MRKLKSAGKSGAGEELVYCPVCNGVYLRYSLVQHWSQMAGKEAQYAMAELYYNQKPTTKLIQGKVCININQFVAEKCPHWKFLLDLGHNAKPVARKEHQGNWYSALQAFLTEK